MRDVGNLTSIMTDPRFVAENPDEVSVPYKLAAATPEDPVFEEIEKMEFYCVLFIVMLFFFVMAACNERFKPKVGH